MLTSTHFQEVSCGYEGRRTTCARNRCDNRVNVQSAKKAKKLVDTLWSRCRQDIDVTLMMVNKFRISFRLRLLLLNLVITYTWLILIESRHSCYVDDNLLVCRCRQHIDGSSGTDSWTLRIRCQLCHCRCRRGRLRRCQRWCSVLLSDRRRGSFRDTFIFWWRVYSHIHTHTQTHRHTYTDTDRQTQTDRHKGAMNTQETWRQEFLGSRSATVKQPSTRTAAAGTFLRFFQTIFENTSLWWLKCLVTLSTYRRYINKCIYLSIYLSIGWHSDTLIYYRLTASGYTVDVLNFWASTDVHDQWRLWILREFYATIECQASRYFQRL